MAWGDDIPGTLEETLVRQRLLPNDINCETVNLVFALHNKDFPTLSCRKATRGLRHC
jgi:hypothetical protein